MSKLVKAELSPEARKAFVTRVLTVVNDEIENLDAIFSSYGNSEYFKGAASGIKDDLICKTINQFMKDTGFFGASLTLVFRRRAAAGANLEHTFVVSTLRALQENSSIQHSLGSINVPYDQFEAQGLYEVADGVYGLGTLVDGPYMLEEEEEAPKEEEKTANENKEETPAEPETTVTREVEETPKVE